jgi:hypothetical protein
MACTALWQIKACDAACEECYATYTFPYQFENEDLVTNCNTTEVGLWVHGGYSSSCLEKGSKFEMVQTCLATEIIGRCKDDPDAPGGESALLLHVHAV